MKLSAKDPKRIRVEKIVSKFTAIVKGFLVRCRYKKFKLISLIENRKAHEIDMYEINLIPRSIVREVVQKERELGTLRLTE